ncbi:MAG: hypothetical protein QM638_17075 [Nocardioides sp.]|uniref:hypothetical protein n=1 Tax=Nocardioides sp. TaxID=35761 RepID=UPI0039E30AE8
MASLRTGWREALVSMVSVLGTWYAACRVERAAGLDLDVVMLATVLALTLDRVASREGTVSRGHLLLRLLALPVVVLAAAEAALVAADAAIAGVAAALTTSIWRRLGGSSSASAPRSVSRSAPESAPKAR